MIRSQKEKNDPSSATTRGPSGSLDLSLSGNVVSISWNEPFGKYVGIEVGVSTGSGMSLGSFSSSNDSGSEKFFFVLYCIIQWTCDSDSKRSFF